MTCHYFSKWYFFLRYCSVCLSACGGGGGEDGVSQESISESMDPANKTIPQFIDPMVVLESLENGTQEIADGATTSNAQPSIHFSMTDAPLDTKALVLWDGASPLDADLQDLGGARFVFSLKRPLNVGNHSLRVGFQSAIGKTEFSTKTRSFTVKQKIARTPPMGWASWNNYRTLINEKIIQENADAMVQKGLQAAGYKYINIDDGWVGGRDANDGLVARQDRFPSGMKALADYIHSKGLLAGIYSDAGTKSCASFWDKKTDEETGQQLGFYGREDADAKQYFIDWGFDYIKIDWCGGQDLRLDVQDQYTKIIGAIRKYSEYVFINVCSWAFPGEAVAHIANSWRTGSDIEKNFSNVMERADINSETRQYTTPGHFNDADMLQVGRGMSDEEDRAHFSLWAIMAAPLILGNDLTAMSPNTLAIVTNPEVIAINQDSAVIPGKMVKTTGSTTSEKQKGLQLWMKPLGSQTGDTKAVLLLNRSDTEQSISVGWADLGLGGAVSVRDVWSARDLGSFSGQYAVRVPSHTAVMLKVRGTPVTPGPETEEPNLAKNKSVRVESEYASDQAGAKAVDGDVATQWTAAGDASVARWIEVDLAADKQLGLVRLTFADLDGTVYKYKIEGSTDGNSWTMLADKTSTGVTPTGPVDEAVQGTYRYVKLTITDVGNGHWPHCKELEIYAPAQGPTQALSVRRSAKSLKTGGLHLLALHPACNPRDCAAHRSDKHHADKFWSGSLPLGCPSRTW